jgi:hypothetical protein
MKIPEFAKAIAGAVVAGLAPAATAAATSPQGVTASTGTASVIAAVVGFALTYFVPNASKAVKEGASGLVVTVKTDVGKFLTAFTAGLPGLVQSSAEAAIAPAPAAPAADAPVPPAA